MLDIVCDAATRSPDRFWDQDGAVRGQAFEQAWRMLRPELSEFSESEICSIRRFLSESIREAVVNGEKNCGRLGVTALQSLSARLRRRGAIQLDALR